MQETGNNIIIPDIKRLTIQLDLSGFSFKILSESDEIIDSGSHTIPSSSNNILDFMQDIQGIIYSYPSLIDTNVFDTKLYFRSEKYALVPKEYFCEENIVEDLNKIHNVKDSEQVMFCQASIDNIIIVYAIPKDIINTFRNIFEHIEFFPNAYLLLEDTDKIADSNYINLDQGSNLMDVAVFEQKKLKLINSFPASDFTTLLYFMIMITKEVVFNPQLTTVKVGSSISEDTIQKLSTYYKKVIR